MAGFSYNQILLFAVLIIASAPTISPALAEGFDQDKVGAPPSGWSCGVTGSGAPVWHVQADATAPSKPNVLIQSGKGAFPWCVKRDVALADGFVESRFKPLDGREDQAGGLVWRWKDGGNYYVARANALENNVSLYYMARGVRHTLKYADAPVPQGQWSTLRVEFSGKRIRVLLNGKSRIDIEDAHIGDAGSVGVWTKADSVTAFDNFSFGEIKAAQERKPTPQADQESPAVKSWRESDI